MGLRVLLLVCVINTVSAAGFSQGKKLDVDFTNSTIGAVLDYLKEKAGYDFVYRKGVVRIDDVVTLKLKDATVEKILDVVLRENGYNYEVVDKVVVVTRAKAVPVVPAVEVVKGQVKDASGKPLPGVTVMLKGTSVGTATNIDGKYEIKVPAKEGVVIVFSFVGMKPQEMKFSGQKVLNVVLLEDVEQMEEVIVTGYSTRKVSEMTGAVQQFRGKNIAQSATGGSLMNALKGHTTGLQITGSSGVPGSDGDLLLRGTGTLYSSSSLSTTASAPLIVIDGVITDYTSINGVVSPSDIADITVLKDAASTAIYGSRAATGVIVVTTKKGVKDRMTVALDMKLGISTPNFGKLEYMNSQELLDYGKMALRNWWNTNESLRAKYANQETFIQDTLGTLYNNFDVTKTTNWRDLVYRNGLSKDVAMSIRGGGDKIQYYFSYNYYDEEGTQIGYDLTRHLFKLRLDFDVMKYLSFGVNLSGTFEKSITANSDGDSMESYHPWVTPYNEDGTLKYNIQSWKNYTMDPTPLRNPLQDNKYNNVTDLKNNLFGSFSATLKPFKWLSFSSTNTLTLTNVNTNDYLDSRTYNGNHSRNEMSNGVLKVDDERSWTFLTSNILRLQYSFGEHNLNGLVGQEWYERHTRSSRIEMYDQIIAGERNVGGFSKQGDKTNPGVIPTGAERESGSFSVFSEVNYNYAGKYMASAAIRADGSSRFGKNNRWGYFPSASLAWRISGEDFFMKAKSLSFVDDLKLRASYGVTGNFQIGNYDHLSLMALDNYVLGTGNGQLVNGYKPSTIKNEDLSWEKNAMVNVGVDLQMFKGLLGLTVDYYNTNTSNMLLNVPVPHLTGYSTALMNIGKVNNRGWEVALTSQKNITKDFGYSFNANYATNTNEVKALGPGNAPIISTGSVDHAYYITKVGEPIGCYYLLVQDGIFSNEEELKKYPHFSNTQPGDFRFVDVDGDGVMDLDKDRTIVGNYMPDFTYGFGGKVWFKGFDLDFNFQGVYGNEILNLNRRYIDNLEGNTNGTTIALNRWKSPEDPGNGQVNRANRKSKGYNGRTSTWHLEDGSYLRLQNVTLGYTLPKNLTQRFFVEKLRVYVSGQNLWTSTNYSGYNPEVNARPSNSLSPGEDYGTYPLAKTFLFGLNITL